MDKIDSVAALIRLNGGGIVGKTRLQKTVYLLEAKGIGFGFDFDYHKYGPFSAELAFATDDAESLKLIEANKEQGFHQIPYVTFSSLDKAPEFQDGDDLKTNRKTALDTMGGYSAIVLELAATAVYLQRNGFEERQWEEVEKRKTLKATPERMKKAKKLVADLGL